MDISKSTQLKESLANILGKMIQKEEPLPFVGWTLEMARRLISRIVQDQSCNKNASSILDRYHTSVLHIYIIGSIQDQNPIQLLQRLVALMVTSIYSYTRGLDFKSHLIVLVPLLEKLKQHFQCQNLMKYHITDIIISSHHHLCILVSIVALFF